MCGRSPPIDNYVISQSINIRDRFLAKIYLREVILYDLISMLIEHASFIDYY